MHRMHVLAFVLLLAGCGAVPQPGAPTDIVAPAATISASIPVTAASIPATAASIPTAAASIPTAAPATATTATIPATTSAPTQPTQTGAQASIPPYTRILELRDPRDEGDEVRAVQQMLSNLGYTQVGAIDDIYGPNTEQTVRDFQRDNQLEVDGVVGPRTWARVFGSVPVAGEQVHAVVESDTGFLLGGSIDGRWIDATAAAGKLLGNEAYRFVSASGEVGNTTGGLPASGFVPCEYAIDLPLASAAPVSDTLAVGGSWDVFPRPREDLAVDTAVYQQEVRDLLVSKGIANPDVRIDRIVRADLDGDGTDEVLIGATRYASEFVTSSTDAGDYSFVVLRKLVDGAVKTLPLAEEYYTESKGFSAPNEYRIRDVLDLNGDGMLEVVLHSSYYEGSFTQVFAVEGDTVVATPLGSGCGV